MYGGFARVLLPSSNCRIDINGIDLHAESASTGHFGSHNRCAAAGEAVEDNAVPLRAILDGISHHGDGLHSRVHAQVCEPSRSQRVDTGVVPDVGSVSSELAKFKIVDMWCDAVLEDEDELMLRPIEGPMPAFVLFQTQMFLSSSPSDWAAPSSSRQ